MQERTGVVSFQGAPLTVLGPELKAGDKAPDFTLLDNDLKPVSLKDFKDNILIIAAVPSLDTPVCDMETRRFNQEAGSLSEDIRILTVSMDLPFAQKRWCGSAGVDKVVTLSDHKDASFGTGYGILIKELRLLARAVYVIGRDGRVAHIELLDDIVKEPDYDKALGAAAKLLK